MKSLRMRTYIPLLLTTIVWLIDVFVVIPLWLKYVDNFIGQWFSSDTSPLLQSVNFFLQTDVGELILPVCLYLFVVRKYISRPIVNTRQANKFQWMVKVALILLVFLLLVPQHAYRHYVLAEVEMGICWLVVGFCEEVSYRGIITRVLKDKLGLVWAVVISSLLFGFSHLGVDLIHGGRFWSDIGNQALFGLVLGVSVWRGGSVLWAVFLHSMFDWQTVNIGEAHWVTYIQIPGVYESVAILIISLIGAEIMRSFTQKMPNIEQDRAIETIQ